MSNIIFDEEIPEDLLLEYKSRVELGKSLAKNKKIVFCGLARNCAKQLENNISLLNPDPPYSKLNITSDVVGFVAYSQTSSSESLEAGVV